MKIKKPKKNTQRYTRNYLPNEKNNIDHGGNKASRLGMVASPSNSPGLRQAAESITNQDMVWADENEARFQERYKNMSFMQKVKTVVSHWAFGESYYTEVELPARRPQQRDDVQK
eukprot:TRINITY_DN8175_c0_g1_i2.p1 TRINITY_DN8175_c0_g1~~TRINITY_DN8175_c0_g1_i2.p1  ORF type:complete len:115 (+),score=23.22 TRINITY_DN8175_c0_g1_i2:129-473(+)